MKKILIILCILIIGKAGVCEPLEEVKNIEKTPTPVVLTGNVVFKWLDISQVEREEAIIKYKDELFDENIVLKYSKKEIKDEYKNYLKDKDFKRHYMLIKNDVKETDNENLCGFYSRKLLYMYAIQYKNDLKTVYYYDTLGKLRYIDKFSENYPNYPYMSRQYRVDGELISAIYFISHDMQYMYDEDQVFKGAWYKDKMYDRHAKQVLTRTNW